MNRRSLLALIGLAPFGGGMPVASPTRSAALVDIGELAAPLALPPPRILEVQFDAGRIQSVIRGELARHGISLADNAGEPP